MSPSGRGERTLTTHVLDTARGRPARAIRVDLATVGADGRTRVIKTTTTDDQGRALLLDVGEMSVGRYEIVFHVGAYFKATGTAVDPPYLDEVPVRFAIAEPDSHYHVPLLVSPFGYTTYRGS